MEYYLTLHMELAVMDVNQQEQTKVKINQRAMERSTMGIKWMNKIRATLLKDYITQCNDNG